MKRNMVYSYILSVLPSTAIAQKLEEDDADFLRRWGITELWMNDRMSNFDYLICRLLDVHFKTSHNTQYSRGYLMTIAKLILM